MLFQLERPFMETDDTVFLDKMVHDKKSTEQHRDDRRNGSPLNPHIQPENENRIKYHIGYRPDQHGKHCFLRIDVYKRQTEDSDVDVYLETSQPNMFALVHIKEDLQSLFGCNVDIVRLRDHMDSFLRNRIEKEGIYV